MRGRRWQVGDPVESPEGIPGTVIAVEDEMITVDFGGWHGRYPLAAPGLRTPSQKTEEE